MLRRLHYVIAWFVIAVTPAAATADPPVFHVSYAPEVADAFSGRVFIMLTRGRHEPRLGPAWFDTEPFCARLVSGWAPDDPIEFTSAPYSYPGSFRDLEPGVWRAQAVLRLNPDAPSLGSAPGTAHSEVVEFTMSQEDSAFVTLRIDEIVPETPVRESDRLEIVELRSELLSDFHERDITMRAAVLLPPDYADDETRRFPVLYAIHGFGGDHVSSLRMVRDLSRADGLVLIGLDASCGTGHHVFADSSNNGPRGQALIEELIPHLEATYRLTAAPHGRLLTGVSSGGWSSLWLQITYPDVFGGTWSLVPDPVDFRDFQQIDLYGEGVNVYRDAHGRRRPIARANGRVLGWYDEFAQMEFVMGRGGQLSSFDAVFSPRGSNGEPMRLFDYKTGAVNHLVAMAWKAYDIRLQLERNWARIGSKLEGKIHVFAGAEDTFYLEGAVELLAASLRELGSDAVVEVLPGRDHGTVADFAMWQRIAAEALEAHEAGATID